MSSAELPNSELSVAPSEALGHATSVLMHTFGATLKQNKRLANNILQTVFIVNARDTECQGAKI